MAESSEGHGIRSAETEDALLGVGDDDASASSIPQRCHDLEIESIAVLRFVNEYECEPSGRTFCGDAICKATCGLRAQERSGCDPLPERCVNAALRKPLQSLPSRVGHTAKSGARRVVLPW